MEQEEPKNEIEKAEMLVKRIEEANAKTEELLQRQEELKVKNILGGSTNAGDSSTKKETDDEKVTRECNKMLEGQGLKI